MNTKHSIGKAVAVMSLALAVACGGGERRREGAGSAATRADKPLTIKGSDTMVILGQRFAEEYMKAKPEAVVQVNGGGSGTGIAALINGTVDLAMASRPMKDEEREQVSKSRGAEVVEVPVALDALAVFVHTTNPVRQLTIEQVRSIFQGKTKNWREVGGANAPIVLYGRESSSGTYDYFREHVLDKGDFAPAVQTLQGTAAIINAVGRDVNGIGYGGIAYASDVRPVAVSTAPGAAGVEPNEGTVADGTYPLSRKLFLYHAQNAPERVTQFVEWTLTPEAQTLVSKVGYFPLKTTAAGDAATTETTAATATSSTEAGATTSAQ